jgi:hypothetical protein
LNSRGKANTRIYEKFGKRMTQRRKHYTEKNFDPITKGIHWLMALFFNLFLVSFAVLLLIIIVMGWL